MYRQLAIAVFVFGLCVSVGLCQQQDAETPSVHLPAAALSPQTAPPQVVQPLSPAAMDALVAGIAFYPDEIIAQILDASQYPDAISQAAESQGRPSADTTWPESVKALGSHVEILQQLDQNAVITARLSLAARTQLEDVWRAVDRVRAQFQQQVEQAAADNVQSGQEAVVVQRVAGYPYPTGAFVAGYWTAQVVDELQTWYQVAQPVVAAGEAVVVGPNGNSAVISGAGAAGAVTMGDTTYYGAAGAGSVTTSNGTVVTGQGKVTGSATRSETGGSYQSNASGSVKSSTGQYAEGNHRAAGSYTNNADGSVDFQRSADTNLNSSGGSSSITHTGSGTYTGQGTGSYEGSTDVQSTRGNVSVETSASDGQVNSTITSGQGEHSVTLGDGQVGQTSSAAASKSAPRSGTWSASSRMARPESVPSLQSRFAQSGGAWQSASRTMSDAWSRLGQQTQLLNRTDSHLGTLGAQGKLNTSNHTWNNSLNSRNPLGNSGPTTFARPNGTLSGGVNLPTVKGTMPVQKPTPNHRSTGGGGGRRGRR